MNTKTSEAIEKLSQEELKRMLVRYENVLFDIQSKINKHGFRVDKVDEAKGMSLFEIRAVYFTKTFDLFDAEFTKSGTIKKKVTKLNKKITEFKNKEKARNEKIEEIKGIVEEMQHDDELSDDTKSSVMNLYDLFKETL